MVQINLLPDLDAFAWLVTMQSAAPKSLLSTLLQKQLPKRLVQRVNGVWFKDQRVGEASHISLRGLADKLQQWSFKPGGTEGYRTAEVT